MTDPSPNRISPDGGPVATTAAASSSSSSAPSPAPVYTVPPWVKVLLAGAIPALGGAAITPGIPPPVQLVCGLLALAAGGIAAHLGMTVGAPRSG